MSQGLIWHPPDQDAVELRYGEARHGEADTHGRIQQFPEGGLIEG